MKILGIFAHPDDETFGPGGTFAKYAKAGHQVYTLTATRGQVGMTSSQKIEGNVGKQRESELKEATKILGVKEAFVLDFADGSLNEQQLPVLKILIEKVVNQIKPEIIIIFEPLGISLHLDHIAVSKAVVSLFDQGKITPKKIYYFGLSNELAKQFGRDYGLSKDEKAVLIDISKEWPIKLAAMKKHRTQKKDWQRILGRQKILRQKFLQFFKKEMFFLARTSIKNLSLPEKDLLDNL